MIDTNIILQKEINNALIESNKITAKLQTSILEDIEKIKKRLDKLEKRIK